MRKGFALPLIILGLLVILLSGVITLFNYSKKPVTPSLSTENADLKKQLADKDAEINALIADVPQFVRSDQKEYSFKEFGVYAPQLDGKKMDTTEFKYKGAIIRSKTITISENQPLSYIQVWEFERSRGLDSRGAPYVIFESEGGGSAPVPIDDYVNNKCKGEKYKAKNQYPLIFCDDNDWSNKALWYQSINLSSFQKYSPTNNPMLVRVGFVGGSVDPAYYNNQQNISASKKRLFEIADSISSEPK